MSTPLIAFFVVFILIFILRMPIPLGLMTACIVYFLFADVSTTKMVVQQMMGKLYNNYTVLAVPLFIFAANVMNSGKITDKIFGFAQGLVGRYRGGLGHVNILASLIFSGMTGSAIADAAGLGKVEIAAMRKEGYDDGFSCAVTAGSSIMGPHISAINNYGCIRNVFGRIYCRIVYGGHDTRAFANGIIDGLCNVYSEKTQISIRGLK